MNAKKRREILATRANFTKKTNSLFEIRKPTLYQ